MKLVNWLGALTTAIALTACGGGGGSAGTSPFGSGSTTTPTAPSTSASAAAASIEVLASAVQIGSGGDISNITATVKDAGNASISGAAVAFSTDSGTLSVGANTASGASTASLVAGADRSNRTVTVTATSGTVKSTLQVLVSGTTLTYSGATTVALTQSQLMTVKLTDSKLVPISGGVVTVASSLNNGLSSKSITTDSQGVATVTYTANNAGSDTVTFSGAGATTVTPVTISAENFAFSSPAASTQVTVDTGQAVTVTYLQNGVPKAGQTVNFAVTAGTVTPLTATTTAAGTATATVTSSTASPAIVQASLIGATGAVIAQATLPVNFVAKVPKKLVLQTTPTAIAPNATGSTTNQAQVLAVVTDANGNPVQGQTVNFSRTADPSGGNLNQASAVTDSAGRASVQYISGGSSTASNGVQLHATTVATAGVAAVAGDATLTVNQSALFIALGTGNVITNLDPQTYKKDWVVYVTDANGVAVPNASLTIKALPQRYGKGRLAYNGKVWDYASSPPTFCANEDVNYNGVLDAGEDLNADGVLQPGNVISVSPGVVTTDSSGRATVSLIYAESYAPWVEIRLVAQAVVAGTESSTSSTFTVTGSSEDFTSESAPPAGVVSPFGVNGCSQKN